MEYEVIKQYDSASLWIIRAECLKQLEGLYALKDEVDETDEGEDTIDIADETISDFRHDIEVIERCLHDRGIEF